MDFRHFRRLDRGFRALLCRLGGVEGIGTMRPEVTALKLLYPRQTTNLLGFDVDDLTREEAIHLAKWALHKAFEEVDWPVVHERYR